MVSITVEDFLRGNVKALTKDYELYELFQIYIIRDGESVLYVGRAVNVLKRLREHIGSSKQSSLDYIGDLVWANMPASKQWQIEVLTIEDCMPMVREQYQAYRNDISLLASAKTAEQALITFYQPSANERNNPNGQALPGHIKEPPLTLGMTNDAY